MIRQPGREQLNRLTVKTLNQASVMPAKEGLRCSQFKSAVLNELVKQIYSLRLCHPAAIQAG